MWGNDSAPLQIRPTAHPGTNPKGYPPSPSTRWWAGPARQVITQLLPGDLGVHGCTARAPIASTPPTLPPSARKCPPIKPSRSSLAPPFLSRPRCLQEEEISHRSSPHLRPCFADSGEIQVPHHLTSPPELTSCPCASPWLPLRSYSAANQARRWEPRITDAYIASSRALLSLQDEIDHALRTIELPSLYWSPSWPRHLPKVAGASPTSTSRPQSRRSCSSEP
jgi:hypothetical protein